MEHFIGYFWLIRLITNLWIIDSLKTPSDVIWVAIVWEFELGDKGVIERCIAYKITLRWPPDGMICHKYILCKDKISLATVQHGSKKCLNINYMCLWRSEVHVIVPLGVASKVTLNTYPPKQESLKNRPNWRITIIMTWKYPTHNDHKEQTANWVSLNSLAAHIFGTSCSNDSSDL